MLLEVWRYGMDRKDRGGQGLFCRQEEMNVHPRGSLEKLKPKYAVHSRQARGEQEMETGHTKS